MLLLLPSFVKILALHLLNMRVLPTLTLIVSNLLVSCLAYTPPELIEPNHGQPAFFEGLIPPKYWYPWRSWHDKGRVDRLSWNSGIRPFVGIQQAVCVHIRPGFRNPSSLKEENKFLGPKCGPLQKRGKAERNDVPEGRTAPANVMCGRIQDNYVGDMGNGVIGNITHIIPDLMGYLAVHGEWDPEECRAECETCFDAMAEFGAEQAFCRRKKTLIDGEHAACGMGFVRWPNPPLACPTGPHAFTYGSTERPACTDPILDEFMPRWWELGFESLQKTLDAAFRRKGETIGAGVGNNNGDVRVYYAHGYDKVNKDDWWDHDDTFGAGLQDILESKLPYNHPRVRT